MKAACVHLSSSVFCRHRCGKLQKFSPERKRYLAVIGVFDGVHLGHKFILARAKDEAAKLGLSPLVITFNFPPAKILSKRFDGILTDLEEKKDILASFGLKELLVLRTTPSLLKMSGRRFIERIFSSAEIAKFIVGEDFCFGRKGRNKINDLRRLSRKYNFTVTVVKKKKKRGWIISSTLIKRLVKKAEFKKVKSFLGRNYSLKGKVIRGKGYGRSLGFPTANITSRNYIYPPKGVYAGFIILDGKSYLSALNLGRRPTVFHSKNIILEAHLINFHRSILGRSVKVVFLEKIRAEKEFSSSEELRRAIQKDVSLLLKKFGEYPLKATGARLP